jgi:NADH-quinone oxidoreductase subunit A
MLAPVLQSYLPVLVFAGLGILVGGAFVVLNQFLGRTRPNPVKTQPYECGLPAEVTRGFRFGVSFYMVAMLFILFDIEVVFLYPVGAIVSAASSVFVLVEILIFVALLFVALVFVWARGALDWR